MTKIRKQTLKALMKDIVTFLTKYPDIDLSENVSFFLDGKQYDGQGNYQGDRKASEITQYTNDDSLMMTFEGPLYDVLNDDTLPSLQEEFNALFTKRGLYYELGNSWNLTVCKS